MEHTLHRFMFAACQLMDILIGFFRRATKYMNYIGQVWTPTIRRETIGHQAKCLLAAFKQQS